MGFYAGMRLELVRTEGIKSKRRSIKPGTYDDQETDVVTGHRVLVKVKKNKTGGAHPESQTTFVFDYETQGIDQIEDLIFCGRELGWIHKKGDYIWLDEHEKEKKHGKARFKKWLQTNPDICAELEEWIRNVDYEELDAEPDDEDDEHD